MEKLGIGSVAFPSTAAQKSLKNASACVKFQYATVTLLAHFACTPSHSGPPQGVPKGPPAAVGRVQADFPTHKSATTALELAAWQAALMA